MTTIRSCLVWVPPEADSEQRIQVLMAYLGELENFSKEGGSDREKEGR